MHEYISDIKLILIDLEHFMNQSVDRIITLRQILNAWSMGKEVGIILTKNSEEVIYSCNLKELNIDEYNNEIIHSNVHNNLNREIKILSHREPKDIMIKNINSFCSSSNFNIMKNTNYYDNFDIINYKLSNGNTLNHRKDTNIGNKSHDKSGQFIYSINNYNNYDNSLNKNSDKNASTNNRDSSILNRGREETESGNVRRTLFEYSEMGGDDSRIDIDEKDIRLFSENLISNLNENVETFEEEKYMQKLLAEEFNMKNVDNKRRYYYKGPFICLKCDSKFNCRSVFYKHKKISHPYDSISTLLGRPRTYNRIFNRTKKKKVPTATLR